MFQLFFNYYILLLDVFIHNFSLVDSVLFVVPALGCEATTQKISTITKAQVIGLGPNSRLLKQYKESLVELSPIQREAAIGLMLVRNFSTSGPNQRLTNLERAEINLPQNLKEILVGLLLGDLCAQKRSKNGNTNLHFEQGLVHKDYIFHLYDLFKSYCNSEPKVTSRLADKRTGNIYTRIQFVTYCLPCFNELYFSFYPEGKKIVPLNIEELLTPLGLAYWISDDGYYDKKNKRVIISTDSYTLDEVNALLKALTEKFNLSCYVNKHGDSGYILSIATRSVPVLQTLLAPVMPAMMKHKVDLTSEVNLTPTPNSFILEESKENFRTPLLGRKHSENPLVKLRAWKRSEDAGEEGYWQGSFANSELLRQYKESLVKLSQTQREVAIGLMLGCSTSLQTKNGGKTFRMKFEWGDKSKFYLDHVFNLFDEWVLSDPHQKIRLSPAGNKITNWGFQTMSHEAFNFLAQLFLNLRTKSISTDLIKNHLTPRGLAYWFMDDGGKLDYNKNSKNKGVVLNTQSFKDKEVEIMAQQLMEKFNLDCEVRSNKGKKVIVIKSSCYPRFLFLIDPYILTQMRYKLP